ncbi:MAG: site-2 protease family protein, partial [Rhodospirillaceae bacterium]|nr:site-2 protease family protein [Rhodospirillaceae bacterium]
HSRGLLGVTPDYENIVMLHQGPLDAVLNGFTQTYAMTAQTLNVVGEIFEGDRSAKELGGVLAIAETSGRMAQVGLAGFLTFMALLSVNLGLINLFPIPVLDGGHLVFYAFEALRGRPLSLRVQEYGFRLGLVLVLLLMIFATWNDVERLLERFWIG